MTLADDTKSQSDVHYRGLRDWLDKVQGMGELLCVNGAHWNTEMGSITQMLTEKSNGTAPAILFDEVPGYSKGYPHALRPLLLDQARRADARAAAAAGPQGRHRAALSSPHAESQDDRRRASSRTDPCCRTCSKATQSTC